VPHIVLFLIIVSESEDLFIQAKIARLFCVDNYDQKEYSLPRGGLYLDSADQYAFAAEDRSIDHSHYLLWFEDTLRIIAEETEALPVTDPQASGEAARGDARNVPAASLFISLERKISELGTNRLENALQAVSESADAAIPILEDTRGLEGYLTQLDAGLLKLRGALRGELAISEVDTIKSISLTTMN